LNRRINVHLLFITTQRLSLKCFYLRHKFLSARKLSFISGQFTCNISFNTEYISGHMVALLVEAPCYKPEGRGLDSRRGHWIFKLT
jgi:hypothetical protein